MLNAKLWVVWKYILLTCLIYQLLPSSFTRTNFTVEGVISKAKKSISGKVIRAIVMHFPPSISITKWPNGTQTYAGLSIDVLTYFASALNITYEYVVVSQSDLVKYGFAPAQINLITNDKADLYVTSLYISHARYQVLDLSVVYRIDAMGILVPWPRGISPLSAPLLPFQPPVWLMLGISLIVLALVLTVLSSLYLHYVNQSAMPLIDFDNILHNSSFLLSHLTNQGYRYDLRLKSRGSYLLVAIWCLMCVVLANGYGGVLFSYLSVQKLEPALNSIEDIAKSNVKLAVLSRSELSTRLLNASTGFEKIIGDSLRAYPDTLVNSVPEAVVKLKTGRYAFSYSPFYLTSLINQLYQENGKKCVVTLAKTPIPSLSMGSMAYAKNGPYSKAFDEQLQISLENGILEFMFKQYAPDIGQCLMDNQQASAQQKSLTLLNMSSAFLIFALGTSIATLVFIIELISKRIQDHYFTDYKVCPISSCKEKGDIKPGADQTDDETVKRDTPPKVTAKAQDIAEDNIKSEVSVDGNRDPVTEKETRMSFADDADIDKIEMEKNILIGVEIQSKNDNKIIMAQTDGVKPIDRKLFGRAYFDTIEIEELDSITQIAPLK